MNANLYFSRGSTAERIHHRHFGQRCSRCVHVVITVFLQAVDAYIMMAFIAEKIVRVAIRTAAAALASLVRFRSGLDLFASLLNQTIFFSLFGELPLSSFDLTCFTITVSSRGLFGRDTECASTNFAFSLNHFSTPYLSHCSITSNGEFQIRVRPRCWEHQCQGVNGANTGLNSCGSLPVPSEIRLSRK
jgi:hypothetical protein